jgi:hypothetical protein
MVAHTLQEMLLAAQGDGGPEEVKKGRNAYLCVVRGIKHVRS